MKAKEFYFELPDELIAQTPPSERGSSRLLVYNRKTKQVSHEHIKDMVKYLPKNSLMIFNNSKVRKARLYATTVHGGKVEVLLTKNIDGYKWKAIVSKAKKQKVGKKLFFPANKSCEIVEVLEDANRIVKFDFELDDNYLDEYGHIPLPPYIKREDTKDDAVRYQNVYSSEIGSAAAPTAGLHFTEEILNCIKSEGIEIDYVTLHVGLGTFSPMRSENVKDHTMHTEEYLITPELFSKINEAKRQGRPIIAVGTTSVRALEATFSSPTPRSGWQETDIFIYPGYEFKVVNHLFTNFHTPESTLIVMVSAFAGMDVIKNIYQEAINEKYRFFSYGDAMFIL
ncbi:tRNA preQ1(34) S-adenosylmethionine ribosyltransferase-isomerase QueA [Spirochaeta cellobiosiphila]|uniref:tRNA preQ1(34) S-adenosylmethionine ribosyltransferase-isomerase QueA n=1 Tax=Spirochaeta cellobiosiphila TaxID=504483 RepID=UPI0003F7CF5D|nr:tRNA preQ1(34) S-adenosylmethionine ribosyltransferase-isomerase QueA [Spirochaeta cellobiosiphila]